MKTFLSIAVAGLLTASVTFGQIQTFKTFTGSGTSAANVIVPQQPTSQARVVSIIAQSDLATSALNIYSGTTARYIAQANTNISSVVLVVDATNGLANSQLIYVRGASSNVVLTISSYGSTNVWMGGTVTNALGYIIPRAGGICHPFEIR